MSTSWLVILGLMVVMAVWSWILRPHPDTPVANGWLYAERAVSTLYLTVCFVGFALGFFGTSAVYLHDNLYPLAEESQVAGRPIYVAENNRDNDPLIKYRDTSAIAAPDRSEVNTNFTLVRSCAKQPYISRASYSSNFSWMRYLDKDQIQVQTTLCIPPDSVVISNNISISKSYAAAHP